MDNVSQVSTVSRSGTLTVAGGTTATATSVTVKDNANSAVAATLYGDQTFARAGVNLLDGTNTFTAVATDSYGRGDTNTVTVTLPSSVSYTYDDNGNLVSDGQMAFEYDGENQLVAVQVAGSWRSEFRYDGKLRRRVRVEKVWQNSQWVTASETRYVYDGMVVVQERDALNLPTATYTRGLDLSSTREGAGGIGGLLARSDNRLLIAGDPLAHACYHADGNGNITALANGIQGILARYLYDPYGNLLAKAGLLADTNLYRFSSKEIHPNSSLYYYGYRYYFPNLQRWINQDPYTETGFHLASRHSGGRAGRSESNRYVFVDQAPANAYDPWGLKLKFKGCSSQDEKGFRDGLKEKCASAMKPDNQGRDCFTRCLGPKKGRMRDFCTQPEQHDTTVECVAKAGNKDCGSDCAYTIKTTITLCMPQTKDCVNMGLGCVALHEAAHAHGGVGDDRVVIDSQVKVRRVEPFDPGAYDLARCAGCKGQELPPK